MYLVVSHFVVSSAVLGRCLVASLPRSPRESIFTVTPAEIDNEPADPLPFRRSSRVEFLGS